jgi:hypothetical protein
VSGAKVQSEIIMASLTDQDHPGDTLVSPVRELGTKTAMLTSQDPADAVEQNRAKTIIVCSNTAARTMVEK